MKNDNVKFKINKLRSAVLVFVVAFLFVAPVSAASLYFNSPKTDYKVGEQFTASVLVDSVDEAINAFEGKLVFSDDQLEVKEIFIGNSVINFWIDTPKVGNGEIQFSGIVPGGFQGDKGLLFSAVFLVNSIGTGEINFSDYKLLLNDGRGTAALTVVANLKLNILPVAPGTVAPEYMPFPDGTLPEEFTPELTRSSGEFNNQWFLVFATQDKGSGIDYYEVCEGNQDNCEKTDSPYILKDQNLVGKIFVKAVDKRGNGRMVVLEPPGGLVWYEKYQNYVILFLVLVASVLLVLKKYARRV
ncbi:MAG: hypothetical protein A2538_02570 [Candidatus Magasanikbacteria bacterium RIFOXYD2_FULL_41_14]|uniref:Cohesin domain-containing protein n=1 Tax=Candidatus Magasanikbacteria bacterium RIFOXYD2_FULL_41_14 TaxID=1798709 RepID=A0A1F6PCG1_9BACT|nr:MAG: hypothetical protein A2538_02570 [Candidatus Magasanikbacteria bacterium RIFOXYD2_FULL_41_14]